jgi:O-antigen ligase
VYVVAGSVLGYASIVYPPSFLAALGIGALVTVAVFRNRLYGLLVLAAMAFVNTSAMPVLYEISEFSLRPHDVAFVILGTALLAQAAITGRVTFSRELVRIWVPVLGFAGYVGVSVLMVGLAFPGDFAGSAASFARLAQYALLVPAACWVLRGRTAVARFVGWFAVVVLASVAIGLAQAAPGAEFLSERGRVGALLGVDAFGLVGGLTVLLGLIQYRERSLGGKRTSLLLVGGGLLALVLSRSVGAALATALASGAYQMGRIRRDMVDGLRALLLACLGVVVVSLLLFVFRPSDVRGLAEMKGGSFVHRAIMATAGVGIFLQHPFVGVGWQRSSLPSVVAAPELNDWLHRIFPGADAHLFPEVTPTSVHNLYVQVLAELGIVGALLFLWTVCRLGRAVVEILDRLPAHTPEKTFGKFFAFGLIFLLAWWNTNPLYGGQIETFLCFTFLGAIAALGEVGGEGGRALT